MNARAPALVMLCLASAGVPGDTAPSPDGLLAGDRASYRFEFYNDFFFGADRKLSGAMSLQKHSPLAAGWRGIQGFPEWMKGAGAKIPGLTHGDLNYRMGLALGQVVQTPDELSETRLIEEDVPYAGMLGLATTWYGFNDDEFRGFEFLVGVTGPLSLAEVSQKTSHRVLHIGQPRGWENQLDTELLLNAAYMRKWKTWRHRSASGYAFDHAFSADAGVGNMFTRASIATEMRYGRNLPGGFTYRPAPIGHTMHYKATLSPPDPRAPALYASLVLRATAVAHNILLDGSLFQRSHSVATEPVYGNVIIGLNYETRDWALYAHVTLSTDTVDTTRATEAAGDGTLGSITFEWRR